MRKRLITLMVAVAFASPAIAGQFNEILNVGDEAPAWLELPGIDGKRHSLADLKDKQVVVVVFTCNSCAYATAYEDRLNAFTKKYAGPDAAVAVVAINVNRIPEDRLPKMQERAKEKGFNFTYLYDESQKIGKSFGATYTPEFFVLDKHRKIVYMGAMDDKNPPEEPKNLYLERAVESALKSEKPATAETLARGCKVRYARSK